MKTGKDKFYKALAELVEYVIIVGLIVGLVVGGEYLEDKEEIEAQVEQNND